MCPQSIMKGSSQSENNFVLKHSHTIFLPNCYQVTAIFLNKKSRVETPILSNVQICVH